MGPLSSCSSWREMDVGALLRRGKKLAEVKRNLLAPFLEEAAEHYRTEGYVHKYAQGALGYAASFGEWLRVHRVKFDRVTEEHLDGFLEWFRLSVAREVSQEEAGPRGNAFCVGPHTCEMPRRAAVESRGDRGPSIHRTPAP